MDFESTLFVYVGGTKVLPWLPKCENFAVKFFGWTDR